MDNTPLAQLVRWCLISPLRQWWIEPITDGRIKIVIDEAMPGATPRRVSSRTVPIDETMTADAIASAVSNAIRDALEIWQRKHPGQIL